MRVLFESHAATASQHHTIATYGVVFGLVLICLIEEHVVVAALASVVHVLLCLIHLLLLLVVLECAHVPVAVLCHQAFIIYRCAN
jgi:hypothetical protein